MSMVLAWDSTGATVTMAITVSLLCPGHKRGDEHGEDHATCTDPASTQPLCGPFSHKLRSLFGPHYPSQNKSSINMFTMVLCCLKKQVSPEVSRPGTEGYPRTGIFPLGVPGSCDYARL